MKHTILFLLALAILASWGCAEKRPPAHKPSPLVEHKQDEAGMPSSLALQVPLILSRDNYSSATTSLAMALSYRLGKKLDKEDVWKASGTTFLQVIKAGCQDAAGLRRAAGQWNYGDRSSFRTGLTTAGLKGYLNQAVPPVVLLRDPDSVEERYKGVIVSGYDETGFTILDPERGEYHLDYQRFTSLWRSRLCLGGEVVERPAFLVFAKDSNG
ncbi:C39 family peptidase [Desulfohalovibrio reitneri]|uniref:C39 family peptidase n=1 Tax=Desulfohalovibrio reitneri TaxID=1307759 RepID=UPI0004A73289|nr:C39 family peptidase [Desulfohalovibrio reitneri]